MLGKLFNLGAASGTGVPPSPQSQSHKPVSSLESVQEDIHTRSLLFPELQDLYEHQSNQVFPLSVATPTTSSGNSFDYSSDIELDPRDVRIVIMQDALGSLASSLLYDSQAPPPMPSPTGDRASSTAASSPLYPGRATTYPRKPSISHVQRPIVIQPGSPKPRQGGFENRSSIYNRTQGYVESDSQRTWREYREELGTFSSCIFGNSELMAYKGTSTKVHVVPSDTRPTESVPGFSDGRGSVGRSSLRASRLSQSFSSESVPPFASSATSPAGRVHDRKKVLVTRLFPVNLPIEEAVVVHTQQPPSENAPGYPFPRPTDDGTVKKKYQPKQKRTPMYAVALVINLPPSSSYSTPATSSRSGFRGPGSYSDHDYFPSSLSSSRPSGWAMVGQAGLGTDMFETSFGSDIEDHIDAITQHWDIIMRTLNQLQSIASKTILAMLKQADITSPDPLPTIIPNPNSRTGTLPGRRSEDGPPPKPPKTNAKHVTLLPNCLQDNRRIGLEAEFAKSRVVAGIRASRVITGQNRWPIWREEARWVAKWVGGREEGFLFNLLTGFLATHTDWLQALSPPSYRRRHYLQQKGKGDEDASIPARTIVVAQDKTVARRLIFLLAAFLPASQPLPGIRAHRPSTSASLGPFSQSPPSFVVPILKEESLRRKINRRPGTMRAHSRNLSVQSQNTRASAVPPTLAHLSMEGRHERRVSDAGSIRTTHLPIRGGDPHLRKSSTATTGTITSETSIPHFSIAHRAESFSQGRPTSSNSVAADDLKRITRVDSATSHGSSPRQGSRWGSVISTLWSARRRESTAGLARGPSNLPGDQYDGPSSPAKATFNTSRRPSGVLTEQQSQRQPKEPTLKPAGSSGSQTDEPPGLSLETSGTRETNDRVETIAKPQRTPNPSGAFESPVKTSINLEDGVIDVDIPFPDYLTTFETAVSSPSSSGYLSAPGFGLGLDTFEQSSYISMDRDVPVNVAGWLQKYHPDFVLQAVPVQDGLVDEIKASMRAEPSPSWALSTASAGGASVDKWIDVSTAIIADASTLSIRRLRYRRLVKMKMQTEGKDVDTTTTTPVVTSTSSATGAMSPGAGIGSDSGAKDEFIEETLLSLDDVLVEAVEKVISLNNNNTDISKAGSSCSSRSTSKRRGERSNSVSTQSDVRPGPGPGHGHGMTLSQEVPRSQCKTVVLSALEEIIREVIEEREQEGSSEFAATASATAAASTATSTRGEGGGEGGSALREAVRRWLDSIEILE
ncbi:Folliculin-interacting protein N-terminus domain containing protein [Naviculisporaceae sp. PSN 640]